MSYTKTNWVNDTEPAINATNLNKIEDGIETNADAIGDLSDLETTANTDLVSAINEVDGNTDINTAKLNGTQVAGDMVVDSIRSKNLFNKNRLWNAWINAQGDLVESASNIASDYIDIHGMSYITISGSTATAVIDAFYDISGTFVSSVEVSAETATLQVPNNAYYVRVTVKPTALDTYQIEEGSTATPYKPHQELNNQEVYSKGETKIGIWIDSKPLYRKVIVYRPNSIIGGANTVTSISIPHSISNFGQIVKISMVDEAGYTFPTLGSSTGTNVTSASTILKVDSSNITFRIINDTWGVRYFYIILEYTKTAY